MRNRAIAIFFENIDRLIIPIELATVGQDEATIFLHAFDLYQLLPRLVFQLKDMDCAGLVISYSGCFQRLGHSFGAFLLAASFLNYVVSLRVIELL